MKAAHLICNTLSYIFLAFATASFFLSIIDIRPWCCLLALGFLFLAAGAQCALSGIIYYKENHKNQ